MSFTAQRSGATTAGASSLAAGGPPRPVIVDVVVLLLFERDTDERVNFIDNSSGEGVFVVAAVVDVWRKKNGERRWFYMDENESSCAPH